MLSLAKKSGNDPKKVMDMLSQTLFSSPIYQSYGQRIASNPEYYTHHSRGPIPLKDANLFRETASQVALQTPLANLLYTILSTAES